MAGPRQRGQRIAEARLRRAAPERVARAYDTSPERRRAQPSASALGGADVNDRLLTTRQVADYLSFSPETVLRRYRAGEIPGIRLASNVLRFRESEIVAWLEGRSTSGDDRVRARSYSLTALNIFPFSPTVTLSIRARMLPGFKGITSPTVGSSSAV
jgi:excisionase family DNA binding protein